jgi:2-dehydropantoate 2-reductase
MRSKITLQDPEADAPLRIAILGAGNIGSTFASQLARVGGHDVTVIARPGSARLRQLERDGAIVHIGGERAEVEVSGALDEAVPYDLVILTVLAHQAQAVLPTLQRAKAQCVLSMTNNFHPERLQEALGTERCSFGMPFVQAKLGGDGKLKATIGAGGQKTIIGQRRWVDLFNAAGLPARLEPEMPLWLRCHAPMCVAFESVSIAAVKRGRGVPLKEAMVLARGVHAGFNLVERLGYPVYPRAKVLVKHSPKWLLAAALSAMSRIRSFRELLATGDGECRALVDAMVAAAMKAEPPVDASAIAAMKPL